MSRPLSWLPTINPRAAVFNNPILTLHPLVHNCLFRSNPFLRVPLKAFLDEIQHPRFRGSQNFVNALATRIPFFPSRIRNDFWLTPIKKQFQPGSLLNNIPRRQPQYLHDAQQLLRLAFPRKQRVPGV